MTIEGPHKLPAGLRFRWYVKGDNHKAIPSQQRNSFVQNQDTFNTVYVNNKIGCQCICEIFVW